MKRILLLLLALAGVCTMPARAVDWVVDYEAGLKRALQEKRPAILDFYADWCGWCKVLDREVYQHADMAELLADYICIKINVDQQPRVAFAYQVSSLPRTIILNEHGRIAGDQIGYLPQPSFKAFLERARLLSEADTRPAPSVSSEDGHAEGRPPPRVADTLSLSDLVAQLAHSNLGTRIAAIEQVQKKATNTPPFDPWADRATRRAALEPWQGWLEKMVPATP